MLFLLHLQETECVFQYFTVLLQVFMVSFVLNLILNKTEGLDGQVGNYIFKLGSTLKSL